MEDARRTAPTTGASLTYTCLNCSARLEGRSCKLRCPRCGYFESCSDLEPHPPRSSKSPGPR